jgi:hypothetical protein
MPMTEILAGVTGLLLVLVVGALFGRLHGTDNAPIKPIGDRVACGLLALPLISIAVRLAFPSAHIAWVLAAPLPLAVYALLLAGTDLGWAISKKHFSTALIVGIGIIYALMVASVWAFGI